MMGIHVFGQLPVATGLKQQRDHITGKAQSDTDTDPASG